MTMPTPDSIRSKSANVDNVLVRAIEMQRMHKPLDQVIEVIRECKKCALELIEPVLTKMKTEDEQVGNNLSAEQLLADPEMLERFRAQFTDLFQRKLNRIPSTVEKGRMIDPAASTKAILIGAGRYLTTSSET